MPSRRMIDPAFWQSESLMELDYRQRLLFIGLISNADDQGRLKGNPKLVKAMIFPFDDISADEVQTDLNDLVSVECISVYKVGSKTCIQILNWWSYQHPQWAYPSELPPMDGWQDHLRYRQDGKVHTRNWKNTPDTVTEEKPEPPTGNTLNGSDNDCYAHLPKDLPEPLPKETPKALGGSIVVSSRDSIDIDKNTTIAHDAHASDFDDGSDLDFSSRDSHPSLKKVTKVYEQEVGTISRFISTKIKLELDDIDKLLLLMPDASETSAEWLIYAIQQAAMSNVRKWNFIQGTLDNIRQSGSLASHKLNWGKAKKQKSDIKPIGPNGHATKSTFYKEFDTSGDVLGYAQ